MSLISPSGWKSLGRYGSIGFELVASIVIGFFVGRWLDNRFGWHGVGTIGGVLLGVYTGFRTLFRRAKEAEREMDLEDARERRKAREEEKIHKLKLDDEKLRAREEAAAKADDARDDS
jgi:hypothetical protein